MINSLPCGLDDTATDEELAVVFRQFNDLSAGAQYRTVPVGVKLVRSWYQRKDKTNFPDPLPEGRPLPDGSTRPVWSVGPALVWFLEWEGRAGAREGNKNALKHGRLVGQRAERAEREALRDSRVNGSTETDDLLDVAS